MELDLDCLSDAAGEVNAVVGSIRELAMFEMDRDCGEMKLCSSNNRSVLER